jgi:hypothetical protein
MTCAPLDKRRIGAMVRVHLLPQKIMKRHLYIHGTMMPAIFPGAAGLAG